LKQNDRIEIIGLGVLTAVVMVFLVSGQSASAVSTVSGSDCTISFSGGLNSLQMAPAGSWNLASSGCSITGQSGSIMRGTFTGTFVSTAFNGTVSGTWSTGGGSQKIVASSTQFTLSFSTDQSVDKMPLLGSPYQGTLSGTGSPMMFTVVNAGQINVS
jgi:hypothetical protein